MKSDELKLCGLAAVRARYDRDAGSIQRLYFDLATGAEDRRDLPGARGREESLPVR